MKREGAEILQLGPSDGYPPLKNALVEMLRAEGLAIKDENLLITGGCQQALDLLCKAFLRPGDSVLLENPTYPGAIAIFAARARALPGCAGAHRRSARLDAGHRSCRARSNAAVESN